MNKFIISNAGAGIFVLCMIAASTSAKAQATSSPEGASAPPTLLEMPLIGTDEGQRFQQVRSVQASSVTMKQLLSLPPAESGPSLSNITGEALNQSEAEPILGHPLPVSTKTPLGFPRADFATGKSAGGKKASNVNQPSTSALSNTVIK